MSRLEQTFARLAQANQAAFVAYLCAGDPDLPGTRAAVAALVAAGADIVELGLPFSDPLADGATNQAAADRALKAGTTTKKVLGLIEELRGDHPQLPLVIFTYLNPVYSYGYARFLADAEAAGADGILLLDLPPDEAAHNPELLAQSNLAHIRLIAPTTPPARRRELAASAQGFLYYVAREGVTGEQTELADDLAEQLADLRQAAGTTPICVGFGISTPEQAATVAREADGVVVGSAIVRRIAEHGHASDFPDRLEEFVAPLAAAAHQRG